MKLRDIVNFITEYNFFYGKRMATFLFAYFDASLRCFSYSKRFTKIWLLDTLRTMKEQCVIFTFEDFVEGTINLSGDSLIIRCTIMLKYTTNQLDELQQTVQVSFKDADIFFMASFTPGKCFTTLLTFTLHR